MISFALSLAAIRLFLLGEELGDVQPNLFVHDMLLHSPPAQHHPFHRRRAGCRCLDPEVDDPGTIDQIQFNAVVGNPPYGGRKPCQQEGDLRPALRTVAGQHQPRQPRHRAMATPMQCSSPTESNGSPREAALFITNDSFRSLTSHCALRRYILDQCKIVEILLTDTHHFEGVSFQFAGMAITTLEKCADETARHDNVIRLVDTIRDPGRFATPPSEKVSEIRQAEYETLPGTPFFVGVPREIYNAARDSIRVRDVARGRQGLITADDRFFLAGIDARAPYLINIIALTRSPQRSRPRNVSTASRLVGRKGSVRKGRRSR